MTWLVMRLCRGAAFVATLVAQDPDPGLRVFVPGSEAARHEVSFGAPFEVVVEAPLPGGSLMLTDPVRLAAIEDSLEPLTTRLVSVARVAHGDLWFERRSYRAAAYVPGSVSLAGGTLTLQVRPDAVVSDDVLEFPTLPPAEPARAAWFPFGFALFAVVILVGAIRSRTRRRTRRDTPPVDPRDAAHAVVTALDVERRPVRECADVVERSLRRVAASAAADRGVAARTAEEWRGRDDRLSSLLSRCESMRYGEGPEDSRAALRRLRDDALSYLSGAAG